MGDSLALILFSIVCGIGGQLALKVGMSHVGRVGAEALAQPLAIAMRVGTSPFVVGGLGLYALGAVAWLTVLSRVPLSLAYPILAVSYAFTPVLAWMLLGENISSLRWVGILVISLGVLLVSRS